MRCKHEADLIDPFLFPIVQDENTTFLRRWRTTERRVKLRRDFCVSSQDQGVKGQELMILVWVWVGSALLHSAKYFEANVGIAFSQTSLSYSWYKIHICSFAIQIHPETTQLHHSQLELIKHSAEREDISKPFKLEDPHLNNSIAEVVGIRMGCTSSRQ
jgi:hypothetical protein